jgi:hypothetical protein
LQRFLPVLAVGGAEARFQPVWVEDVASAMAAALQAMQPAGDCGRSASIWSGLEVFTLRQLIRFAGAAAGHARPIIALPPALARLQAWAMSACPVRPCRATTWIRCVSIIVPACLSIRYSTVAMRAVALRWLAGEHPWPPGHAAHARRTLSLARQGCSAPADGARRRMKIYSVGGAVRDALLGRPVVDRDHVVVGATPEDMLALGYRPVGKDFPVFLHPQTQEEYALARTERKTAPGYRGFVLHLARRDAGAGSGAARSHHQCHGARCPGPAGRSVPGRA